MKLSKRTSWLLLVAVAALYVVLSSRQPPPATVGALAPSFALTDRDGQRVALEAFRGNVVLVNFWATWCPTCTMELPSLNRLAAHFAGQSLRIIGVSEDGESGGDWAAIDAYRQQHPIDFLVLLDPDGHVADLYGTFGIPESYLLDQEGKLVRKIAGSISWDAPQVIEEIEKLLKLLK